MGLPHTCRDFGNTASVVSGACERSPVKRNASEKLLLENVETQLTFAMVHRKEETVENPSCDHSVSSY